MTFLRYCTYTTLLCLAAASTAFGALERSKSGQWLYPQFFFSAKKGDWDNARNWRDSKLPTEPYARANILAGSTVTVSRPVKTQLSILWLGVLEDSKPAALYLETGGQIETGQLSMPNYRVAGSQASFYLRGGQLSVGGLSDHNAFLDVGVGGTLSGNAHFAMSSGTLASAFGIRVGSNAPDTNVGVFTIQGSTAALSLRSAGAFAFTLFASGTLEFILDEKGVAGLDGGAYQLRFYQGSRIRVAWAAYRGASKTIVLAKGKQIALEGSPRIDIENFPATYTASAQIEKTSIVLKIVKQSR